MFEAMQGVNPYLFGATDFSELTAQKTHFVSTLLGPTAYISPCRVLTDRASITLVISSPRRRRSDWITLNLTLAKYTADLSISRATRATIRPNRVPAQIAGAKYATPNTTNRDQRPIGLYQSAAKRVAAARQFPGTCKDAVSSR